MLIFHFQSVFEFQSNKYGDASYATSKVYQKKDTAKWATAFTDEIYKLSQSEDELKFKDFNVRFFIALDLSGGCFVKDKSLDEVLSKKTVIQIRNSDKNCFGMLCLNE